MKKLLCSLLISLTIGTNAAFACYHCYDNSAQRAAGLSGLLTGIIISERLSSSRYADVYYPSYIPPTLFVNTKYGIVPIEVYEMMKIQGKI